MKRSPFHLHVAATLALLLAAVAPAQDWPQFRGAERDGISPESGLLDAWPSEGPGQVWRMPIGEGFSAVSVVGDRLYTMYAAEHEEKPYEFAAALDAADGREIWRAAVGEKHDTEFGNGPRSTPTVADGTVYVLGSKGTLMALATADGKPRWKVDITETFGSKVPTWGFSTSGFVDGDQFVLQVGGPEGKSHVALDRKTGKPRWSRGDGGPAYNSALPVDLGGSRQYVYIVNEELAAMTPDGEQAWSHPWPAGETHAMPLFLPPDRVFASGTEGIGARMLRVAKSGDRTEVEQLWENRFFRNHFSSSVVHDGHIYGFDNATLRCISARDGSSVWARRGLGKGALILADGKLFVLSDRGRLLLIEASPEGYREKGSVQALEGRCWTAPVLSGGRLYLRSHDEIVAYDVRG